MSEGVISEVTCAKEDLLCLLVECNLSKKRDDVHIMGEQMCVNRAYICHSVLN